MNRLCTLCLTLLLLMVPVSVSAERAKLVTSVHPLALLAGEIAGDQAQVSSLVPAGASPHTYSMRPSERRRLQQADLIVWIGPEMETLLARLLSQSDLASRTLTLSQGLNLAISHSHDHDHSDHDHHHEDIVVDRAHNSQDPHLWLDPALALPMARLMAAELQRLDGVDAARIQDNLTDFESRLEDTLAEIREQLAVHQDLAIFTYHDAFRRFGDYFNLTIAGHLTVHPDRTPGARTVSRIRNRLSQEENPCVMSEPQFSRDWWDGIARDMGLGLATWDPLGSDQAIGPGGYLELLESLATAVSKCRD